MNTPTADSSIQEGNADPLVASASVSPATPPASPACEQAAWVSLRRESQMQEMALKPSEPPHQLVDAFQP